MSRVHLGNGRYTVLESEHRVVRLRQWLEAGPLPDGTVREKDIVQFTAEDGGVRTVKVADLVNVR